MPRTKHARKRASDSARELDSMLQTFDRHVKLRIKKIEREAQADLKSFDTFVDVMISRLPQEIRRMTLGDVLAYNCNEEKENENENQDNLVSSSIKKNVMPPPAAKAKSKAGKRGTTISDDGYASEGAKFSAASQNVKSQNQVSTTRRTRSSTRASIDKKTKLLEINQKTVIKRKSENNFKTPAMKHNHSVYDVVTPKVKPNTPMNILRRPRQGEMVLSMQGSPLLVSSVVEENTANINVPLADGAVMSLLPREGLRLSHLPPLDPETMEQLRTLNHHLEKVMAMK